MKIGSLVRFACGYGSDTFEVVAMCSKGVAIRTLAATATREKGEIFFVDASDMWVCRA